MIEAVLELVLGRALGEGDISAEEFGLLARAVLPEEYDPGAEPAEPLKPPHYVHTAGRLDALAGRAARREAMFRPGDCDIPEGAGIVVEPITLESSSGTLAPKFRRVPGTDAKEAVEYEYVPLQGPGRVTLRDCSDRCVREGDHWRELEAAEAMERWRARRAASGVAEGAA